MEKIYILISKHEGDNEQFVSAHRSLQGAVDTMNEDHLENNDNVLVNELTNGIQESVDRGEVLSCDGGNVAYEITFSNLWD